MTTICIICGKPPSDQPFESTEDNNWSYNSSAHNGCVKKRNQEVADAARKGFGVDPSKDGPEKFPPPDPDLQAS